MTATPYGVDSAFWVRADSSNNLIPADGAEVASWQTEEGYVLGKGVNATDYGPLYRANRLNGKPGLEFTSRPAATGVTAIHRGLENPSFAGVPKSAYWSMFAVVSWETAFSGGYGIVLDLYGEAVPTGNGGLNWQHEIIMALQNNATPVLELYQYEYTETPALREHARYMQRTAVQQPQLQTAQWFPSSMFGRIGESSATGPVTDSTYAGTAGPYDVAFVPNFAYFGLLFPGLVYEVLVVAGDGQGNLSTPMPESTRSQVECALAAKWGLSLSYCDVVTPPPTVTNALVEAGSTAHVLVNAPAGEVTVPAPLPPPDPEPEPGGGTGGPVTSAWRSRVSFDL